MSARILQTLNKQSIILPVRPKGKYKTTPQKYYFPIHNCKIEQMTDGWHILYFRCPFTRKKVVTKRLPKNYWILDKKDKHEWHRFGIPAFDGFVDKPKRKRKTKAQIRQAQIRQEQIRQEQIRQVQEAKTAENEALTELFHATMNPASALATSVKWVSLPKAEFPTSSSFVTLSEGMILRTPSNTIIEKVYASVN